MIDVYLFVLPTSNTFQVESNVNSWISNFDKNFNIKILDTFNVLNKLEYSFFDFVSLNNEIKYPSTVFGDRDKSILTCLLDHSENEKAIIISAYDNICFSFTPEKINSVVNLSNNNNFMCYDYIYSYNPFNINMNHLTFDFCIVNKNWFKSNQGELYNCNNHLNFEAQFSNNIQQKFNQQYYSFIHKEGILKNFDTFWFHSKYENSKIISDKREGKTKQVFANKLNSKTIYLYG